MSNWMNLYVPLGFLAFGLAVSYGSLLANWLKRR
jgi:hypothetical protein